ncbi:FGGY family carbohydrate kinase [Specibacter sp. NPDC078692]|uniref:FGGY-family carbohydrate kinase n=1 Tax=Specibacter sp. NPDC078692 TaxID=3155818 RepID=UPI003441EDB1
MTNQRFVLGIDAGQTNVKAVLHDQQLRPVAVARRSSPVTTSQPRYAERSQDELWAATADAIAEVIKSSGVSPKDIVGVGLAGHGDGLHLVKKSGQAASMAITAMDSRAYRYAEEILADPARRNIILEKSGQLPAASSPGALLKWMSVHDPEAVENADYMMSCKDVIRLRLTGEIATDISDACSSFLDTNSAQWSSEIMQAYGVAGLERLLPELRLGGDIAGHITAAAAQRTGLAQGTPVVIGVHDVQAASIGMSALTPGRLALVAGSFSTNGVTTREKHVDSRWQSRLSVTPDLRIAMSTSPTASPAVEWTLRLLGVASAQERDALFHETAQLSPEAHVPLTLPFHFASPLGAHASAAVAGIRGWHDRRHMFRGTLEGVVLMHVWHTQALAEKFRWESDVVLGGGLSNSPLYTQLVANALRTPISVIGNEEAGSFGAAALAGVSVGLTASLEQAQRLVEREHPVEPTAASAGYWEDVIGQFNELTQEISPWWLNHHGGIQEP